MKVVYVPMTRWLIFLCGRENRILISRGIQRMAAWKNVFSTYELIIISSCQMHRAKIFHLNSYLGQDLALKGTFRGRIWRPTS